jgi:endo-1,4-beta-xylanase
LGLLIDCFEGGAKPSSFLLKIDCMANSRRISLFIGLLSLLGLSLQTNAQLAADKCKFLGNVIAGSTPTDFTTYWNQVTPENAGKWGSVEATRDVMQWAQLDNAYNTAKSNGYPFKHHNFVWGQQQPSWISALSLDEQKEEVEEWIKLYCERYPDTDYIDVVNEPLHSTPPYDLALGSGWNWVKWSFQKARQYCPNAKLILNDYNIINSNSATDSYVSLINMLKADNLVDIIGEQGHFLETTENSVLTTNLDKLLATGLPIQISEYDVNIADDNAQKDKYMSQFPVLWAHPGVQGITLWGYKQGAIWRTDAYLVRSDGSERPALTWLKSYMPTAPGGSFCLPTGFADDSKGLSNFPNPTHDGNITLQSTAQEFQVSIHDLNGRMMQEIKVGENESVNVQLQSTKGIYILKVFDGRKTMHRKVIVD